MKAMGSVVQVGQSVAMLMAALASLALLGACGRPDPPPDILKTQHDALDKAKGVEATIEDSDRAARKKADDAAQ